MKKILAMTVLFAMTAGLAGCGEQASGQDATAVSTEQQTTQIGSDSDAGNPGSDDASTEYFGDANTETEESVSAGSAADTEVKGTFPDFTGKDLDGNDVSSDLFSEHAVTLVNFWFNTCSPCVAELPKLNELNETLQEKGGAVIGVNTETLDGYEEGVKQAKEILETQGASYQNIYFDSDSDAGKYASEIMAFPTTILVDRSGNIIGEPILGGIDNADVMQEVNARIDAILANDSGK